MVSRLEPDSSVEPSRSTPKDPAQNRIANLLKHLFPHTAYTTYISPIPVWGKQPQRPAKPAQPLRPQAPLTRPQPQPNPRPKQDVYSRVRELTKSHLPPKKSSVRVIPNPSQAAPPPPPKAPADPQPKKDPTPSNSTPETSSPIPALQLDEALNTSETKQPMMIFELPGTKLTRGCIGGINGIGTDLTAAKSQADYLKQFVGNYHIEWVHNQTQSIPLDILQTILLSFRGTSTPGEQLQAQWKSFHEKHKNDPTAKYFQICHSQGALHVKTALLGVPPEIRDRVIVLAIAPAVIVPKALCFNSFNYTSRRDPITTQTTALLALNAHSDSISKHKFKIGEELITLDPHPEAAVVDHSFKSPTFKAKIQEHIKEYIQQAGVDSSKTA